MKIVTIWLYLVAILSLFSGCSENNSSYELLQTDEIITSQSSRDIEAIEYIIQPHDRLSIVLYRYPALTPTDMNTKGILVDSNGYISLPLIKSVKVAGFSQPEVAKILEKKYAKYLVEPSLNIEVINKQVYILGEIKNAGAISLQNESMSVIEVIASAGGLTDSAQRDSIFVVNQDNNKLRMRRINLTSFSALQHSNLIVHSNDIIYVQPNKWKAFRVASDDFTAPFETISKLIDPFLDIKYLRN
jgi:polysaccharide export outer membrane protein